jgi:multiple sugar transport system ATP-binding protein
VLLRPDTAAKGLPSVAQVGHPLELYHHPRNRFVAGFIGSPSMNFLQGQVLSCTAQRVRVRLAGGQEVLADAVTPQLHADEPVTVGVRPEHVLLGQGAGRGVVSHLEHLGETTQVYLQVPGQDALLLAKGGSPSLQLGDSVPFDLPSHQVHVFRADGDAVPRPAQPHDVQHGGTPARVACA